MADTTGAVLLSEGPTQPRGVHPSMVQMREFQHQRWRLGALDDYCALLLRLIQRDPQNASLMDRTERALAEATRTQEHLDRMADELTAA